MTNPSGKSKHWAVMAAESKKWKRLVWFSCPHRVRPAEPLKRALLCLTRFSSAPPDPDGLVSGFKHVVDGLVDVGILENDRWENIGMPSYKWEKVPAKRGKIRVEVMEVVK